MSANDRFTGTVEEVQFSDGTSFKFWRGFKLHDSDSNTAFGISVWGRIGADGQAKFHLDPSEIDRKLEEKGRKGYTPIGTKHVGNCARLEGLEIPSKYILEFNNQLRGLGAGVEPVAAVKEVSITDEAQRLVSDTISLAHKDPGKAVVQLGNLDATVAALREQLDQAEAGREIANAVVRKSLEG